MLEPVDDIVSEKYIASPYHSFTTEFLAGSAGGCAGVIIGQPLDTVRVRMQTTANYTNTLDCFIKTVQKERVRGLFKGMSSPLYGEMLTNCTIFGVYGLTKPFQREYKDKTNPNYTIYKDIAVTALCGSISGLAMSFPCTPTELVKIRMQIHTEQTPKKLFATIKEVYKSGYDSAMLMRQSKPRAMLSGAAAFFSGFWITVAREIPFNALYFVSYEGSKNLYTRYINPELGAMAYIAAGGLSGSLCWFAIYPFDVIKSVVQADPRPKVSTIEITKSIYKQYGYLGFTKGLSPTVIRAFPVNAAIFLAYEYVCDVFNLHKE